MQIDALPLSQIEIQLIMRKGGLQLGSLMEPLVRRVVKVDLKVI